MNRRILYLASLVLISVLGTTGFLGFLGPSRVLAEGATHFNSSFSFVDTDPCTGEVIVVTGEFQEVDHVSASDRGLHISAHLDAKGTAVVVSTGAEYSFNEIIGVIDNNRFGCGLTETHNTRILLRAPGGTPNFFLHTVLHITQTANCEDANFFTQFKVGCLGQPTS